MTDCSRKAVTVCPSVSTIMIHAVFFDGLSMREYAKQLDLYPRAVVYRVERLLKALRKML